MASANDLLLDEAIRHQIAVAQYERGVVRQMVGILNDTDAELTAELQTLVDKTKESSFRIERLQAMLASVRAVNAAATAQIGKELRAELKDFVEYETQYKKLLLETFVPRVSVAAINASEVYAAAVATPFQGVLLGGALEDVSASRTKLIERTVARGWVENKTTDEIIRSLRGTRASGFVDGLLERPRREVASIVQTAVQHMNGFVADEAAAANSDIVKAIRWSATLDTRTSPMCRVRDGKLYDPVNHKPIGHKFPWDGGPGRLHWNCRSAGVEVLKSFRELGIDMPEIEVGGTRASMDGQVSRDITYLDWLKRQPAARQDDVLGPTRGALMRRGRLKPEEMYTDKGRFLSLDELRARDADAFRRAGL